MICDTCRKAGATNDANHDLTLEEAKALHAKCKGGTHCDCQHRPTDLMPSGSRAQRRE